METSNNVRTDYWKTYRLNNKSKISNQRKKFRETNPAKIVLANAKARAKKKNLSFNLTLQDMIVPEFCPVLGIKLINCQGIKTDNSPSVDRIDSSKGYVKGNIAIISLRANQIKSNGTIKEHLSVIDYMRQHGQN